MGSLNCQFLKGSNHAKRMVIFSDFPRIVYTLLGLTPVSMFFFAAWEDMQILMAYGQNKAKIKQVAQLT